MTCGTYQSPIRKGLGTLLVRMLFTLCAFITCDAVYGETAESQPAGATLEVSLRTPSGRSVPTLSLCLLKKDDNGTTLLSCGPSFKGSVIFKNVPPGDFVVQVEEGSAIAYGMDGTIAVSVKEGQERVGVDLDLQGVTTMRLPVRAVDRLAGQQIEGEVRYWRRMPNAAAAEVSRRGSVIRVIKGESYCFQFRPLSSRLSEVLIGPLAVASIDAGGIVFAVEGQHASIEYTWSIPSTEVSVADDTLRVYLELSRKLEDGTWKAVDVPGGNSHPAVPPKGTPSRRTLHGLRDGTFRLEAHLYTESPFRAVAGLAEAMEFVVKKDAAKPPTLRLAFTSKVVSTVTVLVRNRQEMPQARAGLEVLRGDRKIWNGETDESGRAVVRGILDGNYAVMAVYDNMPTIRKELTVSRGPAEVMISFGDVIPIHVACQTKDGKTAAGEGFAIRRLDLSMYADVVTGVDEDGQARIHVLGDDFPLLLYAAVIDDGSAVGVGSALVRERPKGTIILRAAGGPKRVFTVTCPSKWLTDGGKRRNLSVWLTPPDEIAPTMIFPLRVSGTWSTRIVRQDDAGTSYAGTLSLPDGRYRVLLLGYPSAKNLRVCGEVLVGKKENVTITIGDESHKEATLFDLYKAGRAGGLRDGEAR